MKVLHLLKTEPNDNTLELVSMFGMQDEQESTVIRLDDSTDYNRLIDTIFEHDKVISWW